VDFGRSKKKVMSRTAVSPAVGRLRIRWGRNESMRMLSHLDNMKVVEKAIRESKFPVAYTQGTKPRMKLSFCPPLPTGFTSETELTDILLEQNCTAGMIENIRNSFPDGFSLLEAKTVFAKSMSLSDAINRVVYVLSLGDDINISELNQKILQTMKRKSIEITRKTKAGESQVDIRTAVYDLKISGSELVMTLGIGGGGYARPTELARLLFEYDDDTISALPFHRREMYRVTDDNRRIEGIEL
jgi:radical SAM-linked protein